MNEQNGFHEGQRCTLVAGDDANVGATVVLLQREPNGWLFEEASQPLVCDDGHLMSSSWAPNGEIYVVREEAMAPAPVVGSDPLAADIVAGLTTLPELGGRVRNHRDLVNYLIGYLKTHHGDVSAALAGAVAQLPELAGQTE